jgi:ketosteroid isomerase-like protein
MVNAPPDSRTAAEWVAGFAAGWAEPSDAESFCDHFDRLLDDDIRLIQPQLPTTVGKQAFRERFARPLFELLDDLRGTVESWAATGDVVLIELTIRARLGSRPVELRTVDRITLRDGLATERVAHLDPTPLLGAVALSPRAWPRFSRIQLGRLMR